MKLTDSGEDLQACPGVPGAGRLAPAAVAHRAVLLRLLAGSPGQTRASHTTQAATGPAEMRIAAVMHACPRATGTLSHRAERDELRR